MIYMQIKVSIVVPVYNAQDYIDRCLESITAQTLKSIEIILIDDGSTDASGELCLKWADKDKRIRVIRQENRGLTAAWKHGVLKAEGEFIGFVDSDDYILNDMYEKLYEYACQENCDVVCCGIHHVFEDNDHKPWDDQMLFPGEKYTQQEMKQEIYPVMLNDGTFMGRWLQPNRVSKLVKRSLLLSCMDLCDERVTVGEDFQFSLSLFLKADRVGILKNYLPYFYWVNKKSMTGDYDDAYLGKILLLKSQLERISNYYGVYDFSDQICNDFLCLCILHIKSAVMKLPYKECRKKMEVVCRNQDVENALKKHTLIKIALSEKVFLLWMKMHWYFPIYVAVKMYFR